MLTLTTRENVESRVPEDAQIKISLETSLSEWSTFVGTHFVRITFTHLVYYLRSVFCVSFCYINKLCPLYKPRVDFFPPRRATCAKQTQLFLIFQARLIIDIKICFFFFGIYIYIFFYLSSPRFAKTRKLSSLSCSNIGKSLLKGKRNDSRYFANYFGFSGGTKNLRTSFGRTKTLPQNSLHILLPERERWKKPKIAARYPSPFHFVKINGSLDFAARRYQPFPVLAAHISVDISYARSAYTYEYIRSLKSTHANDREKVPACWSLAYPGSQWADHFAISNKVPSRRRELRKDYALWTQHSCIAHARASLLFACLCIYVSLRIPEADARRRAARTTYTHRCGSQTT